MDCAVTRKTIVCLMGLKTPSGQLRGHFCVNGFLRLLLFWQQQQLEDEELGQVDCF